MICSLDRLIGLKFHESRNNRYIMYSPDMSPFSDQMTVCSWLRDTDQTSGNHPVFHYGPSLGTILDATGRRNCIESFCLRDFRSQLAAQVTKGDWFHVCVTWNTSSRSMRYYANGKLLVTQSLRPSTDSSTVSTGHTVVIGNHNAYRNSYWAFTGEMRNLNVYSKELTSEEVRRQVEAGMCSLNQDENEEFRVLKWEDILKIPRKGPITELPIPQQCSVISALVNEHNRTTTQLEETLRTLDDTRAQLNTTLEEKERISETLQETQENLNTTLEEKERISETLQETQENLSTTLEEKERISETLQETQENLSTTLEEKERISETLQETEDNLSTTLEEKERISETLQETHENLNTTLEEKDRISKTFQETQENLNTTLEEKDRISDTLQKTQENLNSTQLKLEKVSSNLTTTLAELQVALDQIKNCNKTRWDWELFSQSEYFNKTISEEVAEQLSSGWDDIAGCWRIYLKLF